MRLRLRRRTPRLDAFTNDPVMHWADGFLTALALERRTDTRIRPAAGYVKDPGRPTAL